jgi:hypothetical protein
MTATINQEQLAAEDRARRRVREVRDFWGHFWFFAAVMSMFVLVDLVDGSDGGDRLLGLDWAYFPLIGWGAFVLAHFLSVYVLAARFSERWEDRKVAEYLEREETRTERTTGILR